MRPEGLSRLKISRTPSGIKPVTFRHETQWMNDVHYRVSHIACLLSGKQTHFFPSVASNMNIGLALGLTQTVSGKYAVFTKKNTIVAQNLVFILAVGFTVLTNKRLCIRTDYMGVLCGCCHLKTWRLCRRFHVVGLHIRNSWITEVCSCLVQSCATVPI